MKQLLGLVLVSIVGCGGGSNASPSALGSAPIANDPGVSAPDASLPPRVGMDASTEAGAPRAIANGSTGEAGTSPLGKGTSYYVDGTAGNDDNSGTSSASAWKSITKVNASSFNPGDNVLFREGETFTGSIVLKSSGTATDPITYGSYGLGPRPTIRSAALANAIDSNAAEWIILQDLRVDGSTAEGVHIKNGGHLTVRNLDLQNTCGGIQAWFTTDIWVENNVVHNGCGEAIWSYQVTGGFHVIGNRTYPMSGATTDGMQLDYTPTYEVRCNYVDQGHQAGNEKGDLTITRSNHGLVRDNVFAGGNYGVGMVGLAEGGAADNTVTNNHFVDNQNIQSWASGIKFDDNPAEVWVPAPPAFSPGGPTHMTITDNLIEDDNNGIYIYDINAAGDTLTIDGNVANGTKTPFEIDQSGIGSAISDNDADAGSPLGLTSCAGGGMPEP